MTSATAETKTSAPESSAQPSTHANADPPESPTTDRRQLLAAIDCAYSMSGFAEEAERLEATVTGLHEMIRGYADGGSGGDRTPTIPMCESVALVWSLNVLEDNLKELGEDIRTESQKLYGLSEQNSNAAARPSSKAAIASTEATERGNDITIATPDLADIRERVNRIGGLVQAAVICEHVYSDGGHTADVYPVKDFCDAMAGSITTAASELDQLRKLLDESQKNGIPTAHRDNLAADFRKQTKQVAALIEAAYVCEWSHEDGGGATKGADYFAAVSGTIQAARFGVGKLLDRVNQEGGAE